MQAFIRNKPSSFKIQPPLYNSLPFSLSLKFSSANIAHTQLYKQSNIFVGAIRYGVEL